MRLRQEHARRGALAGLLAGAAFAMAMEVDLALTDNGVNDFRLLGQYGPLAQHWRYTGPVTHAFNSALLGAVYASIEPSLHGPEWARGMTFALAEHMLLWPLVVLIDGVHPAIARGELARFNSVSAFGWETLRHAAYGLVLGLAYPRIRRQAVLHHA
jgi:hypothetical protein